eukprot:3746399-Pyramimonas_sp.AAC.1
MVTGPAQARSITGVQPRAHAQIKAGQAATSLPQAIADIQMDSWRNICEGARRPHNAMPRPLAEREDAGLVQAIGHFSPATLPVPTLDQVRQTATTLKWRTGLGADALPPRAISLTSDEALAMRIYIYWVAGASVRWPTAILNVHHVASQTTRRVSTNSPFASDVQIVR